MTTTKAQLEAITTALSATYHISEDDTRAICGEIFHWLECDADLAQQLLPSLTILPRFRVAATG